jgi:hypothetical protein
MIGFHLSSLYSPVGWMSWGEVAEKWIAAAARPGSPVPRTLAGSGALVRL